jgi:CRISPR system Cascade subunit CasB
MHEMQNDATTVRNTVDSVIKQLTTPGTGKRAGKFTAWGTAMLARLRRAAGTLPGESADVWEVTIGALPDDRTEEARERAELAVHTTLTLFGLHQQGSYKSVHVNGVGFGKAVKGIVDSNPSSEAGVRRRFNALATASEFAELSFHARGLVQLMRAKGSGFDYPGFAEELYRYQTGPEERDRVRMRWARDFYAFDKTEQKQNIEEDDRHEQSLH